MYRARFWLSRYRWSWLDRLFTRPMHDQWYRSFEQAVAEMRIAADAAPPGVPVRVDVRRVRP